MGSNTGQVMTLTNSIIGVSILAMPYCFKQCGIVLSVLLLCLSSLLSRFACHFLLKAAIITRRRNYEFLAFHVFGSTGKLGVELAIIGFLLGTCIAFFVVMGDLGPAIISSMLGFHRTDTLRTSILVGMALFVVLPLGLLKNVDSLSSLCAASFAFYVCLVLKVVGEAAVPLMTGDWLDQVNFWRPEGIWQCSPIFSMALFCQTQLFEIFDTVPNVALDKLNAVVRVAINLCTAVYISVGFFGYVAFSKENITGNILVSLSETMSSEVIKVGFVLSVAVSFPLVIFPCRASLYSLLYRSAQPPVHDIVASHVPEIRFKTLTIGIVGVSLVLGLLLPNIERVLGIIGSTIGVGICIITPSLLLGNTARHSKDRLLSQVIMWAGAIIMVLGTYAHILNSEQASKIEPALEGDNFIIDHNHAVDRLNEQPPAALAFQPLRGESNVKKLIDTSGENGKAYNSESRSPKSNSNKPFFGDKSALQKNYEVNAIPAKVDANFDKTLVDTRSHDKLIETNEKLQEPPIPADTGEKQQEPPIPVDVVVKQASAQPVVAVVPAPVQSSESPAKESKLSNDNTKNREVSVQKSKVSSNNAEEVNQDAIRHEDAESALEAKGDKEKSNLIEKPIQKQAEVEDQKKKAEEQKLMETLKEHQEVQRDILNEQQKILQEMKKHEHGQPKAANEIVKDVEKSAVVKDTDKLVVLSDFDKKGSVRDSVKPKNSHILHSVTNLLDRPNNDKIQLPENVFARKEAPAINKTNIPIVSKDQVQPPGVPMKGEVPAPYPSGPKLRKAGSVPVIPLPLAYSAKVSSSPPPAKIHHEQVDSKPAARDILESGLHQADREKRDVSINNIEAEQGAGNGPEGEEDQKHVKNEEDPIGASGKQCTQYEKEKKKKEASLLRLQHENRRNFEHPKMEVKDVLITPKTINPSVSKFGGKDIDQPAVELKTPSSISEPHVEIRPALNRNAQKYSENGLLIYSTNNLKSVHSKEGQ